MPASKHSGFGQANGILDELEELKDSARLRSNDLKRNELSRATASASADASADASAFCQMRLRAVFGGILVEECSQSPEAPRV